VTFDGTGESKNDCSGIDLGRNAHRWQKERIGAPEEKINKCAELLIS
jgi:hypothetical protein